MIDLPAPELQIDFSRSLKAIRSRLSRRESPSTNRFYRISELKRGEGDGFRDFRSRVLSLVGIPG